MEDLRKGSKKPRLDRLMYFPCQLIVSSRNGPSFNGDNYFKENLVTIKYNFLLSDLNLHLPVLESIYCNLFAGYALNYLLLSLRNFRLFSNLRSKSAIIIGKLFRGRTSAFVKLTFLSLERTRGNEQMKKKKNKNKSKK